MSQYSAFFSFFAEVSFEVPTWAGTECLDVVGHLYHSKSDIDAAVIESSRTVVEQQIRQPLTVGWTLSALCLGIDDPAFR